MQAALQRPFSSALGLPRPARGCTRCQVECKSSGRTAGHKRRPQALVTTGADVTILTRTSQTDRNAALPDQHCDRRQAVAVLVGLGAGESRDLAAPSLQLPVAGPLVTTAAAYQESTNSANLQQLFLASKRCESCCRLAFS